MISQARAEAPNECCGLLAGALVDQIAEVSHRFPLANAAATPWNRYESSPESMFAAMKHIRQLQNEIVAVYHSHPTGGDRPSTTDREMNYSPEVVNIIIDLSKEQPIVRTWLIGADDVQECGFLIVESFDER